MENGSQEPAHITELTPEEEITKDMSIEALMKILRTQSIALVAQDARIKSLIDRDDAIVAAQNVLRDNIDTLATRYEQLSTAFLRALPRQGAGPEAN